MIDKSLQVALSNIRSHENLRYRISILQHSQ